MKGLKIIIGLSLFMFLAVSCATNQEVVLTDHPDFDTGYQAGWDMADKDGMKISCGSPWRSTQGLKNLRRYLDKFTEEGKSDGFRSGFSNAYKKGYNAAIEKRCD